MPRISSHPPPPHPHLAEGGFYFKSLRELRHATPTGLLKLAVSSAKRRNPRPPGTSETSNNIEVADDYTVLVYSPNTCLHAFVVKHAQTRVLIIHVPIPN